MNRHAYRFVLWSFILIGIIVGCSTPSESAVKLAVAINQHTDETVTADEVSERIREESDELLISRSKLEEAYLILIPVVQDYSEAQEIVESTVEVRLSTGLDFVEVVQDLADAYAYGVIVTDDAGSFRSRGLTRVNRETPLIPQPKSTT